MRALDLRALRAGVLATAALLPVVLVVAGLLAGSRGALSALGGVVLTVVFFALSVIVCAAVAKREPMMLLPAAVGIYSVKIVALAGLLAVLRDSTVVDTKAFAWAVVATVAVWLVAETTWLMRARIPYVEPEPSVAAPDPAGTGPGSGVPSPAASSVLQSDRAPAARA